MNLKWSWTGWATQRPWDDRPHSPTCARSPVSLSIDVLLNLLSASTCSRFCASFFCAAAAPLVRVPASLVRLLPLMEGCGVGGAAHAPVDGTCRLHELSRVGPGGLDSRMTGSGWGPACVCVYVCACVRACVHVLAAAAACYTTSLVAPWHVSSKYVCVCDVCVCVCARVCVCVCWGGSLSSCAPMCVASMRRDIFSWHRPPTHVTHLYSPPRPLIPSLSHSLSHTHTCIVTWGSLNAG